MFVVYWAIMDEAGDRIPCMKEFETDEMTVALKFMEMLRAQQRAGVDISHVTMSSENPNSVGNPGVAEVNADYSWTMRRHNERPRDK